MEEQERIHHNIGMKEIPIKIGITPLHIEEMKNSIRIRRTLERSITQAIQEGRCRIIELSGASGLGKTTGLEIFKEGLEKGRVKISILGALKGSSW